MQKRKKRKLKTKNEKLFFLNFFRKGRANGTGQGLRVARARKKEKKESLSLQAHTASERALSFFGAPLFSLFSLLLLFLLSSSSSKKREQLFLKSENKERLFSSIS